MQESGIYTEPAADYLLPVSVLIMQSPSCALNLDFASSSLSGCTWLKHSAASTEQGWSEPLFPCLCLPEAVSSQGVCS